MKKKSVLCLLLATILATTGLLSGCGDKKQASSENEGTTLTYWVGMDANLATRVQSYNDVAMYKQREKDSGIHIEFIHPAIGQEAEQFNLLLASNDLPDIIEYEWHKYPGGPQAAIEDGIIIPLNDYLEYAPNFKKALTGDSDLAEVYERASTTDDGKYYGFTTLNTGEYRVFGGPCIRRDWLEDLGLEMPETIDEWTEVLTAFKEKKNAKVPLTGTADTLCLGGNVSTFSGAFGVGNRWYVDGDKVMYGPMQDGYKEYLTLLNKWYKEGLLDKDITSNKSNLVDARITNGESGALVNGYIGGSIGRYLKQKETEEPSYDLVGAPYPVKNKGDVNQFAYIESDVNSARTLAITTACKNPEKAIAWADYWYGKEGYMLLNFGVEGDSYTMVDGSPVYTDKILKNSENLSVNEALLLNCRATSPAPGFKQAPEYLQQYYEYDQQNETLNLWTANVAGSRKTTLPSLNSTSEEMDIISSIKADLSTYVNECIWNFVSGKTSLDKYDEFREELVKTFRVEEYRDVLQKQYDRYINK